MERAFDGHDTAAACHLESHAQGVFIGFGAGVHEEHAVEGWTGELHEPRCGAHAHVHRHGIALEVAGFRLAGESARPARVLVAECGDRVAAVEIEHAAAIARVQPDALGIDDLDGVLREHGSETIGGAHGNPR